MEETNTIEVRRSEKCDLFNLVKKNEKVKIACSNAIVSTLEFDTFEDAEDYIDAKPYELIINTTCYIQSLKK